MRGSTLTSNKAMPVGEKEEEPADERSIRAGKMHAADESSKCVAQLDGLRRVAEGARKSLL